jgi:hypothetical protein
MVAVSLAELHESRSVSLLGGPEVLQSCEEFSGLELKESFRAN